MKFRLGRTALVPVALFVTVALAPAGIPLVESDGTPYFWSLDSARPNVVDGKVTFYVDPRGTRDATTGPLSAVEAQRAGVFAWEGDDTRIRFMEDVSRPASGPSSTDGVNWVGFVDSGLSPMTFAATIPTRSAARLQDADVLFNDRDFIWNTRDPGVAGSPDIQALMTHEWGHAIGAEHVPLRQSTMYFSTDAGSTSFRTLSADDRALVASVYPGPDFTTETGAISGVVTREQGSDHRSIHVVAISLATGEPASSALTDPLGRYVIRGLPRGTYRVVATPTLPLGKAMNSFWRDAENTFLPTALTEDGANPGALREVEVAPGLPTQVPSLVVERIEDPLEPDDTAETATEVELDTAVVARFESASDRDHFAFDGEAGQVISVQVLAWNLGGAADPAITLQRSDGFPIVPEVRDQRGRFDPDGPDLDPRIVAFELPSDDRYVIRARSQVGGIENQNFYLLLLTEATNAPSAALTEVTAEPARVDADGSSSVTVSILPRRETGVEVGTGATVRASLDGPGTLGAVRDQGDGTYVVTVTAPTGPSAASLSLEIETEEGLAVLDDAADLTWLGPVDGDRSDLDSDPRRIDADGVSRSIVSLEPRDVRGERLGAGRSVTGTTSGDPAGSIEPVVDQGTGRYLLEIVASDEPGELELTPAVDGVSLGRSVRVAFGFDLDAVLEDAGEDLTLYAGLTELRKAAKKRIRTAVKVHDQALDARSVVDAAGLKRALTRSRRLVVVVSQARKKAKGGLPGLPTEKDVARAIREQASLAVGRAVIVTGRDQGRVDKANDLLTRGDEEWEDGSPKRAAARWLKAFKRVRKLQPID